MLKNKRSFIESDWANRVIYNKSNAQDNVIINKPVFNELEWANKVISAKIDIEEKNHPTFWDDFLEGFKAPYLWVWNTGEKVVDSIDKTLNLGGKALDSFIWIMNHPYIILLLIVSGVIIIKNV